MSFLLMRNPDHSLWQAYKRKRSEEIKKSFPDMKYPEAHAMMASEFVKIQQEEAKEIEKQEDEDENQWV